VTKVIIKENGEIWTFFVKILPITDYLKRYSVRESKGHYLTFDNFAEIHLCIAFFYLQGKHPYLESTEENQKIDFDKSNNNTV
jgi:hypothetical protein